MLLTGVYAGWAASIVVVMLASFMIAVGIAMVRKLNLNCSCFGLLYRERVGWSTQIRDAILLVMALLIVSMETGDLTLSNMLAEPERLGNALGLAATILTLGLGLAVASLSVRLARRHEGRGQGLSIVEIGSYLAVRPELVEGPNCGSTGSPRTDFGKALGRSCFTPGVQLIRLA